MVVRVQKDRPKGAKMFKKIIPFLICTLLFGSVPQAVAQTDYERVLVLYQQVISGQKRLEDLKPQEQRMVIIIHQTRSNSQNITGYDFSLRDVENKCEVYRYSDSYGWVECRGSSLRIVEQKCEAYFSDTQSGEIECRGSDFREIERKCSVTMYSELYGEIDC